jgi:hypothetical protein
MVRRRLGRLHSREERSKVHPKEAFTNAIREIENPALGASF